MGSIDRVRVSSCGTAIPRSISRALCALLVASATLGLAAAARADVISSCGPGEHPVGNPTSPGAMHHGGFHCAPDVPSAVPAPETAVPPTEVVAPPEPVQVAPPPSSAAPPATPVSATPPPSSAPAAEEESAMCSATPGARSDAALALVLAAIVAASRRRRART